jgi:predicted metal-dependent HD superfamily phosphohydrolase
MDILRKTEDYVTNLLLNKLDSKYAFHNLRHSTQVVEKASTLATSEKIRDKEQKILLLAAWFHDTGFIYDHRDHEKRSCVIATEFLSSITADDDLITDVSKTILCTRLPQNPVSHIQEILCDADLHHLGSKEYETWSRLLLMELQSLNLKLDEKEWVHKNILFFEGHRYFTASAKELWQTQKLINLQVLRAAAKR